MRGYALYDYITGPRTFFRLALLQQSLTVCPCYSDEYKENHAGTSPG